MYAMGMEWNISPVLFKLGAVEIRYYSLMFILGFIAMGYYMKRVFQEDGLAPKIVDSLTNYMILGMLIGARLGHCLFYDPGYYLKHPLEILMVWEGGLASHGGYLGVVIAMALFSRKQQKKKIKISFRWLADNLAGPVVFVGALIRIGNLFNSEILGRPTDLPWAVVFKRVDNIPRHPAQVYESMGYFLLSLLFMYLARKKTPPLRQGATVSIAMILAFGFRFLVEFVKDNQSTLSETLPINMGQILSLLFMAGGVILLKKYQRKS